MGPRFWVVQIAINSHYVHAEVAVDNCLKEGEVLRLTVPVEVRALFMNELMLIDGVDLKLIDEIVNSWVPLQQQSDSTQVLCPSNQRCRSKRYLTRTSATKTRVISRGQTSSWTHVPERNEKETSYDNRNEVNS